MKTHYFFNTIVGFLWLIFPFYGFSQQFIPESSVEKVRKELISLHGNAEHERINMATSQIAEAWKETDGTVEDFEKFCTDNFLSGKTLSDNFYRLQDNLTYMQGHLSKIRSRFRESSSFTDVQALKADNFLPAVIPTSDLNKGKTGLFIQLNFPRYTEDKKLENKYTWTREKWAMVRLGDWFAPRNANRESNPYAEESGEFRRYMERYFFRMDAVTDRKGKLLFPSGELLHSHRGLRDAIKDEYTKDGGKARQEVMNMVIERVTDGNVPVLFLTDTTTRWNPFTNKLYSIDNQGKKKEIKNPEMEYTKRYAGFSACVSSKMFADSANKNTVMDRTFAKGSLSLENVEKMIRQVLSDPVLKEIGKLVENNLGRKLQPFDIWYSGFQEQAAYPADYLDSLTKARYPTPLHLEKDLSAILVRMGFPENEAHLIGSRASVRPIVSGGYSSQSPLPGDTSLMTTMFAPDGLDYKSYRVAMHELGHTVCANYCTDEMDFFILAGVPSSGITEGFAELLAYKNVAGLNLFPYDKEEQNHLLNLAAIWYLLEMGGQSLVEIESWKWMYANPQANPEEVRKGIMNVAETVWNDYFAPIFNNTRNQHILSIYNHYITGDLYLYNYFLSNVIMYQLHSAFDGPELAYKLKSASREGRTTTERWMKNALGEQVSVDKLLNDAKNAINYFNKK